MHRICEAPIGVRVAQTVGAFPGWIVAAHPGDNGEAAASLSRLVVGQVGQNAVDLFARKRGAAQVAAAIRAFNSLGLGNVVKHRQVEIRQRLAVDAGFPVVRISHHEQTLLRVVSERNHHARAGRERNIGGFSQPAVAELRNRFGRRNPAERPQRRGAEVGGIRPVRLGHECRTVGGLHRGRLAESGRAEKGAVFKAAGIDAIDLPLEVDADVLRCHSPPAVGRKPIPEARAAIEAKNVGLIVRHLGQRRDVRLHDPLLLISPADQLVHIEPHPELGGAEDGSVRVKVIVRLSRHREAQCAAAHNPIRLVRRLSAGRVFSGRIDRLSRRSPNSRQRRRADPRPRGGPHKAASANPRLPHCRSSPPCSQSYAPAAGAVNANCASPSLDERIVG